MSTHAALQEGSCSSRTSSFRRVEAVAAHQDLHVDRRMQDAANAGAENETDATTQKPRRKRCCRSCRNHKLEVPVINHHCPHADCSCVFCELTRRGRKIMRHQLRLWRFKKFDAGLNEGENNPAEVEMTPNKKQPQTNEQLLLVDPSKLPARREMLCDKCRNHNEVVKKRGHKGSCPYEECTCVLCTFTIKRQQLMKHQQRVRRSQKAAPSEHTERTVTQLPTDADSPTSDLQPLEASPRSPPPRNKCEEGQEDGSESSRSSSVPVSPPDAPPTEEWMNAMKEYSKVDNSPRPQDFHSESTIPRQPPPPPPSPPTLEPLQEYHKASEVHSSHPFNKSDQSISSLPGIERPDNMRLSVRYSCFGPLAQGPAASASLPTPSRFGQDAGHQHFLPWCERISRTSERCMVGANNNYPRPQAPLRPQPIPAARLPRSPMDWQFIGFPYPPASMLQPVPQPAFSASNNFRIHQPPAALDEQWHAARGPLQVEGSGVHPSYSAGLPYFASALLHPSAKSSLSVMPPSRTLSEYGPSLPVFRQRDQHQDDPLGAFTRSTSDNVI